MDKYLAVFTAALFLTALFQCCLAAGGANPADDPVSAYVTVLITNRLLYEITRQDIMKPSQDTVKRWIDQLNKQLHCGLSYSLTLASTLIDRVKNLKFRLKGKGGRRRETLLAQTWTLTIPTTDNLATTPQKSDDLSKQVQSLQSQVQATSRILREIQLPTPSRKRTAKHYSQRHERRIKKMRQEECAAALSWLDEEGLTPVSVTVMNLETQKLEKISLRKDLEEALNLDDERLSDQDADLVSMMLYVKDRHHVSGNAYHELASLCRAMPRHYKLKEKIRELNSKWNISPTPEGTVGVQQSFEERLLICTERLIDSVPKESSFLQSGKLRVKLTGDGTNIGKHLHVVNFAFTILEEGDKAYGAAGNHCIAIFKEAENYDAMKTCLKDIVQQVEELENGITVRGQKFEIQFYLGGDWKFLAMITGINSATSTHTCIWCKCPTLERYDSTQKWSIFDCTHGARTIEENRAIAQSKSKKYNVAFEPIFRTIPLTRVVVDNLHMFLRVADTLIDLFILELRRLDKIEKATKVASLDKLQYLKKYESTVKSLGITGFSFWIGRESKKLKWRSLTGPEKLILLENINLVVTFPQIPNCEEVQSLWRELIKINRLLSTRPNEMSEHTAEQFQKRSKEFVRSFTDIYPAKHVTPYMHCMMMHVSEFMEVHGALLPFTQQGLEKYNDQMTKDYFRSSSHRGQECLIQIMQKQNRIEHLEHSGARRSKRYSIRCSNCDKQGHNRLTCTEPCKICNHTPFSSHLVDGKSTPQCQSHT